MNKKKLIKQAIEARNLARTRGNYQRSNRINYLLYLVAKAGDDNGETLARLEKAVQE